MTTLARSDRTLHLARVWFLGIALLAAPTIAFVHRSQHGAERSILFVAAIASTVFVLIRFASAVRSLERAERQLSFQASHDPLTGLANRTTLAERLVHDIAVPVEHEGQRLTVSASIGIAAACAANTAALLRAADTAMYGAKRLGRGRWVLAEGQTTLAA